MPGFNFRPALLALLACLASLILGSGLPAGLAQPAVVVQEQQAAQFYQAGEFQQAARHWQQAARAYQNQGDAIGQARVASNLALAYQKLDQWPEAEAAIAESFQLLETEAARKQPTARLRSLAQALNNQGSLQLLEGQAREALTSWEKAEETYKAASDGAGIRRSQTNQALALQALGFHARACENLAQSLQLPASLCQNSSPEAKAALTALGTDLPERPNSLEVAAWQTLGNLLQALGESGTAAEIFESLEGRVTGTEKAKLLLSLGNAALGRRDFTAAANFYREAGALAAAPEVQLQSQLSQLHLWLQTGEVGAAAASIPAIQANLERLPASREKIAAQLNLVQQLLRFQGGQLLSLEEMREILETARQQAQRLGDGESEAYLLGSLGTIAARRQQWAAARQWTQQALSLAEGLKAPQIAYRWQGQLGQIWAALGERQRAIDRYSDAIATLESIAGDLAATPELQATFQETIEPLYRQLTDLYLQPDSQGHISQEDLRRGREVMEALQRAELVNFLQQDCLEVKSVDVGQLDSQAALIYPIVLPERLAVVLQLPGERDLHYYSTAVPAERVRETAAQLRHNLVIRSRREYLAPARQLYDWLLGPGEEELGRAGVSTLIFALHGSLRNVPMSALHDGKGYLIERYAVALTPGLQLLDPHPLTEQGLSALTAGLAQARQGFPALSFVGQELAAIGKIIPSTSLVDRQFNQEALARAISSGSYPIVHIATHGQFSSEIEETFLLTWDGTVNLRQLDRLLRSAQFSREVPLELLLLSACETASGDERAALGLAGMAVRSGARSTIATLWPVNDEASAQLVGEFYRALAGERLTKAQSLRQAQLSLLRNKKYLHPYYWAAYLLVGNWL